MVLYLRKGGEIVCARSLIERIEPDAAPPAPVQAVVEPPPLPARPFAEIIDVVSVRYDVNAGLGLHAHRGGVGLSAGGSIAQGSDGAHAVDAFHGDALRCQRSV